MIEINQAGERCCAWNVSWLPNLVETEDVGAYTWELATSNQDVFGVRNGLSMEPGLRNGCVELEETVAERTPSFQRLLGYVHTQVYLARPTSVDLLPPSIARSTPPPRLIHQCNND